MVIKTKILPPGACAFTFWPFVFVHPRASENPRVLLHEGKHLEQQRRWAIYGLGVGLLVWYLLYLLALPVGWNPWRRKWETEALVAEGGNLHCDVAEILRRPPYYLWWM